jgi:hypothetical protein
MHTLAWFLFHGYETWANVHSLSSCPAGCGRKDIPLSKGDMGSDYTYRCPNCNAVIYLSDVFRFHEVIEEVNGAGGVLGYLTTLVEQLIIIHYIRIILSIKPSLLNEILFIKDGPLAFFGQTANMQKYMLHLLSFLRQNHDINMCGIEKSGIFIEHGKEIYQKLDNDTIFIYHNDYIYHNILPYSSADQGYGHNTYYGAKLIYKADNTCYTLTIPANGNKEPKKADIVNIDHIANIVKKMK